MDDAAKLITVQGKDLTGYRDGPRFRPMALIAAIIQEVMKDTKVSRGAWAARYARDGFSWSG